MVSLQLCIGSHGHVGLAAHAACLWFTNDYYNMCCAGHCVLLYCTVMFCLEIIVFHSEFYTISTKSFKDLMTKEYINT